MKKQIITWGLMFAATLALTVSCAKEQDILVKGDESMETVGVPFELFAGVDTKTSTTDASTINWVADDKLNVFIAEHSGAYGDNNQFTITSANLEAKKFTGTLESELDAEKSYDWKVIYPYNSDVLTVSTHTENKGYLVLGSKTNATQTQVGNNSKAHLAGSHMPLYGKAENVSGSASPSIALSQIMSVLKVHVTNTSDDPLTVSNIAFSAPAGTLITGTFYVDYSGDAPTFSSSGESYTSNIANLTIVSGEAIAKNETADFYIAVKPFSIENQNLSVSVNGNEIVLENKTATFAAGKIKTVNFNYSASPAAETLPYSEALTTGWGKFTSDGVQVASTSVWTQSGSYGLKATAYINSKNYASESWVYSPWINLTSVAAASLNFDHVHRYAGTASSELTLWVLTDEGGASWEQLTIPNYAPGSNWTFVNSGTILLTDYIGHNIKLGFKYLSSTTKAATWEIKNFSVLAGVPKTLAVSTNSLDWAATETSSKEVTVTLNAGASGYTVSPSSDTNWNISDNGTGTITVSPKAANTSTENSKTLNLTITHNDDGGLSETVVCTQAKVSTVSTWTRVTSTATLLAGGTFIIGYEATAKSGVIVPLRSKDCGATTSANGILYSGTTDASSSSGTINMSDLSKVNTSDFEVYISESSTSGRINIQRTNSSGSFYGSSSAGNSKNTARLYSTGNSNETNLIPEWASETNNQFKLRVDVSGNYKYLKYNSGSPRFAFYDNAGEKIVFYKKD